MSTPSSSRSAEDVQFLATGTSKEEVVQRLKGRIFQLEEEVKISVTFNVSVIESLMTYRQIFGV